MARQSIVEAGWEDVRRASKTAMTDFFVWQYYETAANLGDTGKSTPTYLTGLVDDAMQAHEADTSPWTDAMNEVAWCYLEGFGCKKDKVSLLRPSVASRFSSHNLRALPTSLVAQGPEPHG